MSAAKGAGILVLMGIICHAVAFGATALIHDSDIDVSFIPLLFRSLFVIGSGLIFAALWTPALVKTSRRILAVLVAPAGTAAALCFFMMFIESNDPDIFSPWLLGYPLLGLALGSMFHLSVRR
ncbi:hypothetical protein ACGE24_06510 [Corynebacterium kroppenstedtii]|uniref:hypothetical protein n=1 Tax=Corynebacterium sp. PCR 32 TaxID=3351342 RepID=UPI0030A22CEA